MSCKLSHYSFSKFYELIWSNGACAWLIIVSLFYAFVKKKNKVPYMVSVGIWLTILISVPVDNELRYAYALFVCTPILVVLSCMPDRNAKESNKGEGTEK